MRRLPMLSLLLILSACSITLKPINNGHGTTDGPMGTTVREVSGYGLITQVSAEQLLVNIKHAPIPELNWAPMLMTFKANEDVPLENFDKGDKVLFVLELDKKENHRLKLLEIKK